MKFSALTKKDLIKAYSEAYPLTDDISWVDSGEARHILDYLFGVNISKAMTDSVWIQHLNLTRGNVGDGGRLNIIGVGYLPDIVIFPPADGFG